MHSLTITKTAKIPSLPLPGSVQGDGSIPRTLKGLFQWLPSRKDLVLEGLFQSSLCLSESCHSRQVLGKQREQGFEPENQQGLGNIVMGTCLLRAP